MMEGLDMNEADNIAVAATEAEGGAAHGKPHWKTPRFEVMPLSMIRNSHPLKPNDITGGPAYS